MANTVVRRSWRSAIFGLVALVAAPVCLGQASGYDLGPMLPPTPPPPAVPLPPAPSRAGDPTIVKSVDPEMPDSFRARQTVGEVTVSVVVDTRGRPADVRASAFTHLELVEPAVAAMKQWRFTAGRQNGRAVRMRMLIPMRFDSRPQATGEAAAGAPLTATVNVGARQVVLGEAAVGRLETRGWFHPVPPMSFWMEGAEGQVTVLAELTPTGEVGQISILQADHAGLAGAVEFALGRSYFHRTDYQPVGLELTYTFRQSDFGPEQVALWSQLRSAHGQWPALDEVDTPVEIRRGPEPASYPLELRGQFVTAQLLMLIDAKGRVVDARLDQPLAPAWERMALMVAHQFEFVPAQRDGVAVPRTLRMPLRLRGSYW